jgi:hypothetical protein
MTKRKLTTEQLVAVEELAEQWGKIVARRAYGDAGPGLDVNFDEIEQLAATATRGLARGTLEYLVGRQTEQLPDTLPCPTCTKPCPVTRRPREVVARGATVTLQEPVAHCPACRRDFFPQRPLLKLDSGGYSPSVLHKILHAGAILPKSRSAVGTSDG